MVSDWGRHLTADRRQRHGLQADDHCYLCDQEPGTIDHIIISCSFSRQIWWNILEALGADASRIGGAPSSSGGTVGGAIGMVTRGRAQTHYSWWWHVRFGRKRTPDALGRKPPPVHQLLRMIKHTTDEWIEAGAQKLSCLVRE
jgi:hypothetical protein